MASEAAEAPRWKPLGLLAGRLPRRSPLTVSYTYRECAAEARIDEFPLPPGALKSVVDLYLKLEDGIATVIPPRYFVIQRVAELQRSYTTEL